MFLCMHVCCILAFFSNDPFKMPNNDFKKILIKKTILESWWRHCSVFYSRLGSIYKFRLLSGKQTTTLKYNLLYTVLPDKVCDKLVETKSKWVLSDSFQVSKQTHTLQFAVHSALWHKSVLWQGNWRHRYKWLNTVYMTKSLFSHNKN